MSLHLVSKNCCRKCRQLFDYIHPIWPALPSAICWGDSPRATSYLIRPIMRSNSASPRSTPILDSRSSASASACALAAEYSQRHLLEQLR